jgi:DNA-binding CsgD family transcriptional regulator
MGHRADRQPHQFETNLRPAFGHTTTDSGCFSLVDAPKLPFDQRAANHQQETTPSVRRVASAAQLWDDLALGRRKIIAYHSSETHCYLALCNERPGTPTPPSAVHLHVLEQVLLGDAQKVIAIERGFSCSTISGILVHCLRQLGVQSKPRSLPLLLAIAAHARKLSGYPLLEVESDPFNLLLVAKHPVAAVQPLLTPVECQLARLVMDGRSQNEMVTLRKTSPRTIANQVQSIFQKLGVSGRFELIARALRPLPHSHLPSSSKPAGPLAHL